MNDSELTVSEIFSSIQGEGSTMGKPSIFIRLRGCNLLCGNPKESIKDKTQAEIEAMQGDNATWTCDTISVWSKGEGMTIPELLQKMTDFDAELKEGAQIVLTGGEPLIQAKAMVPFIAKVREYTRQSFGQHTRIEVETNGTLLPPPKLRAEGSPSRVDQFNCSPKLMNSGMAENRRIKSKAMNTFSAIARKNDQAIFKFVVTDENDLYEVENDYVRPFALPRDKIWLMPGCSNREQFEKVAPLVSDICRIEGYKFSSRLQINLWNQTTGV